MAEPARNPVYDPEDDDSSLSARQRADRAWGMTSDEVKDAEESAKTGASDDKEDKKETGLFRDDGKLKKPGGSKLKKRILIGGGVAGTTALFSLVFFFAALPFKMVHIVENLQKHFYATADSAVAKYSDTVFSNYIKKYVMPGLRGTCTSTKVDAKCVAVPPGTSPITKLYRGWADNRFEQKLALNYGLVISREGSNYYMRIPGMTLFNQDSKGFDITGFDKSSNKDIFDFIASDPNNQKIKVSQAELRQRVRGAVEAETKSKRLLYRFKLGRFLERKYGLPRCVVACKKRDAWADWKNNKKLAFKTTLVQRIVTPHGEIAGIIMNCLISGGCTDTTSVNVDGKGNGSAEREITGTLDKLLQKISNEATKDAIKTANEIADKGGSKWLIEQLLAKMGVASADKIAENTVNSVNWVTRIATALKTMKDAGPMIKRLTYVSGSVAMAQLWMTYRSHVDEIKAGQVTEEFVASFNNGLDGLRVDSNGKTFVPPGGAQNAENSPLYKALLGAPSTPSAFNNLFSAPAYAQTNANDHTPGYTCNNGKPIESGKLVCPEESLLLDNGVTAMSDFLSNGVLGRSLDAVLTLYDNTLGRAQQLVGVVTSAALDAVLKIPYVGSAVQSGIDLIVKPLSSVADSVMQAVVSYLIPSPISPNMSGARTFNMMAGGADVSGNDYAHFSLGGKALTPAQTAAIRSDQMQSEQLKFAMKPWHKRMFDTNDSNSLISQVAMALPSNTEMGLQSFASSLISNPFSKLFNGFGALFVGQKAHAAIPQNDPFGIVQFGFPLNDPVFTTDPETYTDEYCKQFDNWINEAHDNGQGQFVNDRANPCLLQRAAIEGLGGLYDSSLIPPQDQ